LRLAVILVHYHTPALAAAAVEALRLDMERSGLEDRDVEWLLVDNGSDEAGRVLLDSLPVQRIDPGENLGYAGGVNLGVARSSAEAILLMNPDVLVLPGCVPALLRALDGGAAVAGPCFCWDAGRRLLLPPSERRSRRDELISLLALRGGGWAERARRRWRRHARRHWRARRPLPSYALSGSLLAVRRSAWEAVGPFDTAFRLFFEETDWLRRVEARRLPAWYVPAAEAVHLYGQSAVREPRARRWFEESAQLFRTRYYGAWFSRFLTALSGRVHPFAETLPRVPPEGLDLSGLSFPLWIEVSPNATGFPAAAERLEAPPAGGWRLPDEVVERLPPGDLVIQAVDEAGRELLRRSWPHPRGGRG
jgi:N-acetylglucosaminyl-diphospho-decaprenol L-rhamnosyltransferase